MEIFQEVTSVLQPLMKSINISFLQLNKYQNVQTMMDIQGLKQCVIEQNQQQSLKPKSQMSQKYIVDIIDQLDQNIQEKQFQEDGNSQSSHQRDNEQKSISKSSEVDQEDMDYEKAINNMPQNQNKKLRPLNGDYNQKIYKYMKQPQKSTTKDQNRKLKTETEIIGHKFCFKEDEEGISNSYQAKNIQATSRGLILRYHKSPIQNQKEVTLQLLAKQNIEVDKETICLSK